MGQRKICKVVLFYFSKKKLFFVLVNAQGMDCDGAGNDSHNHCTVVVAVVACSTVIESSSFISSRVNSHRKTENLAREESCCHWSFVNRADNALVILRLSYGN